MSVLSMVAFRMVTQEGLRKCLKIYEKLKKSDENTATSSTAASTTTTALNDDVKSVNSRSAKRRIRRKKLKESIRSQEAVNTKKQENTENDNEVIDVAPYNLVTHADKRASKDFLERSLMAAFLLKCLLRTGFFACPTLDDGTCYITLYRKMQSLYLLFFFFNRISLGDHLPN